MSDRSEAAATTPWANTEDDAVAIIGGGIVGLATAVELARRGRPIVIVDQAEIGAGCGIGSAGHIVPSHVIPLAAPGMAQTLRRELGRRHRALSIAPTVSPSFWAWAVSFLRHCTSESVESAAPALAALGQLSAELTSEFGQTTDIHYADGGLLDVYGSENAFEQASSHADELRAHGVDVLMLDAQQTRELEPTANEAVIGSLLLSDDASIRPASLLDGLRDQALRAGVVLASRTEATGLQFEGGHAVAVQTNRGPLPVGHVVVAAGAWSGRFGKDLDVHIPVVSARGLSLTVDRPAVSPRRAMLLGEQHVAIGPNRDELRMSGWFELGRMSLSPPPRRVARLETLARSRLDFDTTLTNRRTWAGLRPMTPDGVPIIGASGRWQNVTIATGHAMIGLSMGLGTGRVVAQLVDGERPDVDLDRFSLTRFS